MANGTLNDVQSALAIMQQAVMSPDVVRTSGAGKAFQSVSQSCAITVQDATDYLRNVMTISATATGVGVALIAAGDDTKGNNLIDAAQKIMTNATSQFAAIGQAAAATLNAFPSS